MSKVIRIPPRVWAMLARLAGVEPKQLTHDEARAQIERLVDFYEWTSDDEDTSV